MNYEFVCVPSIYIVRGMKRFDENHAKLHGPELGNRQLCKIEIYNDKICITFLFCAYRMLPILQLNLGHDQDEDYVAEESVSSSDYFSTTAESGYDDDEKNVASQRRNLLRLQSQI